MSRPEVQKIPQIHPINFAVNAYQSRSRLLSSERVLNLYGEPSPLDSPFKAATVFNTPGLILWNTFANNNNPIYGLQVMGDFLYAVIGLTLYKISKTSSISNIGTLGTTPASVQMTENGNQLTILTVSGNSYYYDVTTDTFAQITDGDYQLASSVTTLDGYTVFSKIDSGQFFISALRDTTTYSALDFATAEALSDNIVRIVTYNRQLYIFGTNSIEIWYNTGNVTFPFQRIDGALIQRGLGATYSTAVEVDGIYWLGEDRMVYRTRDYFPQRISTYAIETQIASYSRIDDATAFIYTQGGHKFYCLTFPSANRTWVYDLTTELWHERGSLNVTKTEVQAWVCQHQAFFNGLNIVNGRDVGKLYLLDLDTYTEDEFPIIREAISCTQFDTNPDTSQTASYNLKTIDRLGLMMDFGVGIDGSGQGINPLVMMSFSIDGGYTWSKETTASLGDIGVYPRELYWERLGLCRSFIVKLRVSDPVKVTILGGYLKAKDGVF